MERRTFVAWWLRTASVAKFAVFGAGCTGNAFQPARDLAARLPLIFFSDQSSMGEVFAVFELGEPGGEVFAEGGAEVEQGVAGGGGDEDADFEGAAFGVGDVEIGRASCRERV